jgi:hypothetical protein
MIDYKPFDIKPGKLSGKGNRKWLWKMREQENNPNLTYNEAIDIVKERVSPILI